MRWLVQDRPAAAVCGVALRAHRFAPWQPLRANALTPICVPCAALAARVAHDGDRVRPVGERPIESVIVHGATKWKSFCTGAAPSTMSANCTSVLRATVAASRYLPITAASGVNSNGTKPAT